MTYTVRFSDKAAKAIAEYKKHNPLAYEKTSRLLKEISQHPRTGTGHPEPLSRGNNIRYSRRISKKDRLVYDIYDDIITVLILLATSHYSEK